MAGEDERLGDRELGLSIRFIRQWKPPTPEEDAAMHRAFLSALWAVQEARRVAVDAWAYQCRQTDEGRAVLRSLWILPDE